MPGGHGGAGGLGGGAGGGGLQTHEGSGATGLASGRTPRVIPIGVEAFFMGSSAPHWRTRTSITGVDVAEPGAEVAYLHKHKPYG